jgi:type IV pilus assembly protein PilO
MTLRFEKKEIYTLLLALVLLAGSIFAGYYFYLSPKKQEVETQTANLKAEKQLLAQLQEKATGKDPVTAESIAVLQRKVPVKAQLEQLILDLEQAEVVSDSLITSMTFSEADVKAPTPTNTEEQKSDQDKTNPEGKEAESKDKGTDTATTDKEQNAETEKDDGKTDQVELPQFEPTPLPAGIKRITATLKVESATYENLKKFIDALENLPRTIMVESVAFSGTEEVKKVGDKVEKLAYSLSISAFYMPGLTDLQNMLPELVAPKPSNKTNPFYISPDIP